jgi:hypothetical protein
MIKKIISLNIHSMFVDEAPWKLNYSCCVYTPIKK